MGMIHYAVNPETKKCYQLGKAAWVLICRKPYDGKMDVDSAEKVSLEIQNHLGFEKTESDLIASHLQKLGPVLELRQDSWFYPELEGFEVVGSA